MNFIDPSGHSILAITLSILAIAGLITTGIGVATDNNTLTAITILIAESNPLEKELMIDLILNFIN